MQAIITKYIGPRDVKGSRVKATAQAGSLTFEWDDALNYEQNHALAALELCRKFKWNVGPNNFKLHSGQLPNGDFCHVMEG